MHQAQDQVISFSTSGAEGFSETKTAKIMEQLFQGLQYMHALSICHRDIKLDNLIYDPDTQTVKIIDFGFAVTSSERLRVPCGTPAYMAPELTLRLEYKGDKTDMWAAGVVMYALLTG